MTYNKFIIYNKPTIKLNRAELSLIDWIFIAVALGASLFLSILIGTVDFEQSEKIRLKVNPETPVFIVSGDYDGAPVIIIREGEDVCIVSYYDMKMVWTSLFFFAFLPIVGFCCALFVGFQESNEVPEDWRIVKLKLYTLRTYDKKTDAKFRLLNKITNVNPGCAHCKWNNHCPKITKISFYRTIEFFCKEFKLNDSDR